MLEGLKKDHSLVVTVEDGVLDGGFGEMIARYYGDREMKVSCYGIAKKFLNRYKYSDVLKENHLTAPQISEGILLILSGK